MTLAFSPPPCPPSLLRKLDPRWKLAGLLLLALAGSLTRTLPASALLLALALLLVLLARLPAGWYLARLGPVALVVALFTLPLPFLLAGEPLWQGYGLTLSRRGLTLAALVGTKALALVSLVLVLLASAPLHDTLKAAHALRIPGLLIQMALLSYRYLFLLADELLRLRIALRVRGFRSRPTRHSYRTIAHLAGTLLVRGSERAERIHEAMRCRGYDGQFRSLTSFRTRAGDVLAFVLLAGIAAGIVLLERLLA